MHKGYVDVEHVNVVNNEPPYIEVQNQASVNIVNSVNSVGEAGKVVKAHVVKESLNCCFLNARGVLSKMDELKYFIAEKGLDIVGIAETWLNENVLLPEVNIDGYKLYRKDRSEVKEGIHGGVLLYVRNEIVSQKCDYLNDGKSESLWCKILDVKNKMNEIIIGVCYKSPNAEKEEIEDLFRVIRCAANKRVIIMGDFNYPNICWNTMDSDQHGIPFRDLVLDSFLIQHVAEPTREKNILDLILTSEHNMVEHLEVIDHLGSSDHNTIIWKLISNVRFLRKNDDACNKRLYYRGNYDAMRKWFADINWEEEMKEMDIDSMWTYFCAKIEDAIERYIPINSKKRSKLPKWMNKNSRQACKAKAKLWKIYQKTRSYNDLMEYKTFKKRADRECKKVKQLFEAKVAENIKKNPKSFYAYVRSKLVVRDVVGPLQDKDGLLVSDNVGMCRILNDYFSTVFTKEDINGKLPEVTKRFQGDSNCMLQDIDLTAQCIEKNCLN